LASHTYLFTRTNGQRFSNASTSAEFFRVLHASREGFNVIDDRAQVVEQGSAIAAPAVVVVARGSEQPWLRIQCSTVRIAGAKTTGRPHQRHSQPSRLKMRTWSSLDKALLRRFVAWAVWSQNLVTVAVFCGPENLTLAGPGLMFADAWLTGKLQ